MRHGSAGRTWRPTSTPTRRRARRSGSAFQSWALEGGQAKITERLNDPATWTRIKGEIRGLLAERGLKDLSFAKIASYRADPSLNGLSMAEAAGKLKGSTTEDAQLETAREMMLAGGASMVYHFMSDDDVHRIMKHPSVGFASDSGVLTPGAGVPHPRGYGNNARDPRRVRAGAEGDFAGRGDPKDDVATGQTFPLR